LNHEAEISRLGLTSAVEPRARKAAGHETEDLPLRDLRPCRAGDQDCSLWDRSVRRLIEVDAVRVLESQKPRVLGRTMGGEGSEGHGAIQGPGAHARSRQVKLRISDARDGFGIRGCDRVVRSIAWRLVAPDARCAEKKVR
jgi:hypothetical protein